MFFAVDSCLHLLPLKSVARPVRTGLLAAVALATLLSCSQTASASCGDYLFRNGKPVAEHAMVEQADQLSPDTRNTKSLPTPHRGCTGPNCSKYPVPERPIPAAPNSQLRVLDPAALPGSLIPPVDTFFANVFPESERGARYLPSHVFRPPIA
jgi:hypothetical protein